MNKNLDRLRRERTYGELIRRHGALLSAAHYAFHLLELDGRDLRQPALRR